MIYDIKNIYYTYPYTTRKVLNGVSLQMQQGEIMSVLGPNGAGKSTLLNCMANLIIPDGGEIDLLGKPVKKMSVREVAECVSYVQQTHNPVFEYSVLHFVTMGRCPRIGPYAKPKEEDEQAAFNALRELGIERMAMKPYTELSGGERQQVTIAQAIVGEPKVILFDEPTAHLDFGNQQRILRLVKKMSDDGYSIVFTTHNPDHAILLGGKVAILDCEGKLETGNVQEIITEEKLREVYKTDLKLVYVEQIHRLACLSTGID